MSGKQLFNWRARNRYSRVHLHVCEGLRKYLIPITTGKTALYSSKLLLLATRLGSCSVVRRWQCFFDSVLFGQDVGESARGAAHKWVAPLLYPSIFAAIICDNRVFRSDYGYSRNDNSSSRSDIPDFGLTASTFRQPCIADSGQ